MFLSQAYARCTSRAGGFALQYEQKCTDRTGAKGSGSFTCGRIDARFGGSTTLPSRGPMALDDIRFAVADSIAFLNASDWDCVSARSGLFLSRRFLALLEQNRPENLTPHYALAYSGNRPVAAVVAQSLDIRIADLSSTRAREEGRGISRSLKRPRPAQPARNDNRKTCR